ncbi:MAG TPA: AAA family ATPase [Mucilaginibacter sp.]|nr:AAA family ATPase [Mucilaginibacter sp.]
MRPPEVEKIRNEIRAISDRKFKAGRHGEVMPSGPDAGLFRTKKANQWMQQEYGKPLPKKLFGSFWFEGELCILFADTNLGKSILAVQLADSITKAYCIEPFANQSEAGTPVLYLDFELGAKQFETRYADPRWGSHLFADEFYRSEFNPEADDPILYTKYEIFVQEQLESAIRKIKPRVLIIDNITYMRNGTEHAKDAMPLMKMLKALKTNYKLSVLVLAHTPKRNPGKPITVNDLQGSKMLINFADSAFAIGKSHTRPNCRYLKQIKQRNQKEDYGETNICLISLQKELNFLCYKFEGYAHERDHLRRHGNYRDDAQVGKVLQLHQQGRSLRQVADEVGIHYTTVSRIVRESKEGNYQLNKNDILANE